MAEEAPRSRVLLHTCCGPCSLAVCEALRERGHEVLGFFYNPNIHPHAEFERRRQVMAQAAEALTPGHRHRVLALNQLNQSNYELLRYLQTRQRERDDRAQLLRDAAEKELARARELDSDAGWPVVTAETPAPPGTERGAQPPTP